MESTLLHKPDYRHMINHSLDKIRYLVPNESSFYMCVLESTLIAGPANRNQISFCQFFKLFVLYVKVYDSYFKNLRQMKP